MTRGLFRHVVSIIMVAAVAACGSLPAPPTTTTAADTSDAFSIGGRISARRGDAGVAGAFTWVHEPRRDAIDIATPLGQTLAKLNGDAQGVSVQLQDGRVESAGSWQELTERALGVTIPVEGLASWVRARPREGAPSSVERDDRGRVSVLRQDGWDVVYAYADDASLRPFRVTLSRSGAEPVDVRVLVDRWQ